MNNYVKLRMSAQKFTTGQHTFVYVCILLYMFVYFCICLNILLYIHENWAWWHMPLCNPTL
jgi:hypothetical protein